MNELERAQAEQDRRSRVMAEARRFSPYGRPERDEDPPAEGGSVPDPGSGPLPEGGSGQRR